MLDLETKLRRLKPQAKLIHQQFNVHKESLLKAVDKQEFFNEVRGIIQQQQEVHTLLENTLGQLDEPTLRALKEAVKVDADLSFFMSHYDIAHEIIVDNRERLTEMELYKGFNNINEEIDARTFVAQVKHLKPIVCIIKGYKKTILDRLEEVESMEELDQLENEISLLSELYLEGYEKLLTYPKNEVTCKKIIDFINKNHELKDAMETFDLYESLTDDILHTRGRLYQSPSRYIG